MNRIYLDDLAKYGNKEIFQKRLNEGYNEMALTWGPWIASRKNTITEERLVRVFAFYGPKNKIATYEFPKFFDGYENIRCSPQENVYTEKKFNRFASKFQLDFADKQSLQEILDNWDEVEKYKSKTTGVV